MSNSISPVSYTHLAANGRLRQLVNDGAQKLGAKVYLPELKFCGDNGAMTVSYTHLKQKRIFSACGGAALYRKLILDEIGTFDENFFAYFEDVDLS